MNEWWNGPTLRYLGKSVKSVSEKLCFKLPKLHKFTVPGKLWYAIGIVEFNVPLDTVGLYVISEPGEFHTLTTVSAKKSTASAVVTVCFIRFIRMSSSLTNIDRTLVYVFMKQRSLGCNWRRTYTGKVLIAVSRSRAEPTRGWVMNETSHSHSHNLRNLFTHLLISRPRRMEGWVGLGEK